MDRIVRFLDDERGSQAIEFMLWVPIMAALLTIVVDASTLYITHKEMENVARDTTRRMVLGQILTLPDARDYAASAMGMRDFPYVIDAGYDETTGAYVTIAFATRDMSIIGYLSPLTFLGTSIAARVVMRVDPKILFDASDDGGGGGGDDQPGGPKPKG